MKNLISNIQHKMKTICQLLLFLSLCACGTTKQTTLSTTAASQAMQTTQQTEILFIGASHNYPKEVSQEEFQAAIAEIVNFAPERFFSETLPTDDVEAMKAAGERIIKTRALLKKGILLESPKDIKARLTADPNNLKARIQLAVSYLKKYDQANSDFQIYQLFNALERLKPQERKLYEEFISRSYILVDSLRIHGRVGGRNEYNLLAFPAAEKLGLAEFLHMGNQANTDAFHEAWGKIVDSYQTLPHEAISHSRTLIEDAMLASGTAIPFDNSEFSDLGDYFVYAVPKKYAADKQAAQDYERYWEIRNQNMANLIDTQLRDSGVAKAAVIVGSAHSRLMKQYLKEKGYKITPLFNGAIDENLKAYTEQLADFKKLFE